MVQTKTAKAEAKAKAAAEIGEYEEYKKWEKEAENYRAMAGD